MMRYAKVGFLCLVCILLLFGCAAAQEGQGAKDSDYEETKKMLVDLLKTDEGKNAIREILSDESMKENIIMDQSDVKKAVESTLTAEKGKKFWQEMMQDTEFAKTFADSMQEENEKLLKGLMKDPEYQTMMMDILKDPEMEKATMDLFKSKEYRQQVMTIMTEAFESPQFKDKISKILEKVAQKQMEKEDQQQGGGGEGGSGGGGGGGS